MTTATIPNDKTQQAYERALARAHDDGCFIGVWASDEKGNRTWSVTNPRTMADGEWYTVRWEVGSRVLSCNCEAGQRAIYCKHRALVRESLLQERAQRQAYREQVESFAANRERQTALVPAWMWK